MIMYLDIWGNTWIFWRANLWWFYWLKATLLRILLFQLYLCVVIRRNGWGNSVPIVAPTLTGIRWPQFDNGNLEACKQRIEVDVHAPTRPLLHGLFHYRSLYIYFLLIRSPPNTNMWISKGDRAFNDFLVEAWSTKVFQHQSDTIKCSTIGDKVAAEY